MEINKDIEIEDAIARLDEIRGMIEDGDVTLNESVKLLEEASALYAICNEKLNAIEDRVKILTKNAQGKLESAVFEYDE